MEKNKQILSDVVVHMKYARFIPELNRRELWEEIVLRNKSMHLEKFPHLSDMIEQAYQYVLDKKILPSMRSMQFAGRPIDLNNARIFNCAYCPIDNYKTFPEIMFLLLSGCGVGYSVQKHHIEQLPVINKPKKGKRKFIVDDSLVGWAEAVKHLVKSYYIGGYELIYDYSDIRPKGARLVTSGK